MDSGAIFWLVAGALIALLVVGMVLAISGKRKKKEELIAAREQEERRFKDCERAARELRKKFEEQFRAVMASVARASEWEMEVLRDRPCLTVRFEIRVPSRDDLQNVEAIVKPLILDFLEEENHWNYDVELLPTIKETRDAAIQTKR